MFKNLTEGSPEEKGSISNTNQVFYCGNFTGELSSKTGIYSRFLFIPKTRPTLTDVVTESPNITIVCGVECKDRCVNLKMYTDGKGNLVSYKEHTKLFPKKEYQVIQRSYVRKSDSNELQNLNERETQGEAS